MKSTFTKIANQFKNSRKTAARKFAQYSQMTLAAAAANPFGEIQKPPGVDKFGGPEEIGILIFLSNIFQLGTVIAGLWVLLNFILAGFEYISSQGDSGAHAKVREKITNSVIGLVIIAVAYTLVAVIGLVLFGSASYFLNPTLISPNAGTLTP